MTVRLREHVGPDGRLVLALPKTLADSDVHVVITPLMASKPAAHPSDLPLQLFGSWEGDFEYPPDTAAGETRHELT